jgi:ankyrin repeat protein
MPPKMANKKKKARSSQAPTAERSLVLHTSPQLAELLVKRGGKVSALQEYLSKGGSHSATIEISAGKSMSLLCWSALRHNAECIRLLLEAGADPNSTAASVDDQVRSALSVACVLPGGEKAVEVLLNGGADPCYQASDGSSALHIAAAVGLLEQCRLLVAAGASRVLELELQEAKDSGVGVTAVLYACIKQHTAVVQLLHSLGADLNSADALGLKPLGVAAGDGNVPLLCYLLQQQEVEVNKQFGPQRDTALHCAAKCGSAEAVQLMLDHGADPRIENDKGMSPVFAAAAGGHLQVLQLLVQHGCSVTAKATQRECTLLMLACFAGRTQVAEFLIAQGLSVQATDGMQYTALHHAAACPSSTECIKLLLAYGAAVNAATEPNARTALHLAATAGAVQNAAVLIAAGADVMRTDACGSTCLHLAVQHSHSVMVVLALEHGAAAVVSTMQCTLCECCGPVSALVQCKDAAVLQVLLAAGGDVSAVTSKGDTCLHVAARHGYAAPVVCLLIKAGASLHAVNAQGETAAQVADDCERTLLASLLNRAAAQAV